MISPDTVLQQRFFWHDRPRSLRSLRRRPPLLSLCWGPGASSFKWNTLHWVFAHSSCLFFWYEKMNVSSSWGRFWKRGNKIEKLILQFRLGLSTKVPRGHGGEWPRDCSARQQLGPQKPLKPPPLGNGFPPFPLPRPCPCAKTQDGTTRGTQHRVLRNLGLDTEFG